MTVSQLFCSLPEVLKNIPPRLSRVSIKDIEVGSNLNNRFVQGKISAKWPIQKISKTRQHVKFTLQADTRKQVEISVFAIGLLAGDINELKIGDHIFFTGFSVEASTRSSTSEHPCQLILDLENSPDIWFVDMPSVPDSPEPSTSAGAGSSRQNAYAKSSYEYTDLGSLEAQKNVNIFGVVKFVKEPRRTRGSDYLLLMSLCDPTLYEDHKKLVCLLFNRTEDALPPVVVGSIVRFHRLKIKIHQSDLQGQSSPGISWLVFDGAVGGSLDPRSSSPQYSLTDGELEKVKALRLWASNARISDDLVTNNHEQTTSLSEVSEGQYFNLVCQVISVCNVEPGVCMLLRCWDGTRPVSPVRELDVEIDGRTVMSDPDLVRRANGYIYDICVFDDHFVTAFQAKPGDYIMLINLHAATYKNAGRSDDFAVLPTVELVLHRGNAYRRAIKILPENDEDVTRLQQHLDSLRPPTDVGQTDDVNNREIMPDERDCHSKTTKRKSDKLSNVNASALSDVDVNIPVKEGMIQLRRDGTGAVVGEAGPSDARSEVVAMERTQEDDRCMMQTATVLLNHHHIKRTILRDIVQHEVPFKFRIQARVLDYFPKAESVHEFLKLYCVRCHYLCPSPSVGNTAASVSNTIDNIECVPPENVTTTHELGPPISVEDGIRYYSCPKCVAEDSEPVDCQLSYIYMMKLLLNDGTSWLPVNLWKDHAVTFFHNISPTEVINDQGLWEELRMLLERICPPNKDLSEKPVLECCIVSYSGQSGTCYQIFDSSIA